MALGPICHVGYAVKDVETDCRKDVGTTEFNHCGKPSQKSALSYLIRSLRDNGWLATSVSSTSIEWTTD